MTRQSHKSESESECDTDSLSQHSRKHQNKKSNPVSKDEAGNIEEELGMNVAADVQEVIIK